MIQSFCIITIIIIIIIIIIVIIIIIIVVLIIIIMEDTPLSIKLIKLKITCPILTCILCIVS